MTTREATLDAADKYRTNGDLQQASLKLRELLLNDPQDYEVMFLLANIKSEEGKLAEAVELLEDVPPDHPEAGVPALGLTADWCMELARYDEAERRYRKILELAPDANIAKRKLAHLLNREGRRHEAIRWIRELCLAGDVTQDELHALIIEGDAMYDEPGTAHESDWVPYYPIGEMGQARYLFMQRKYLDAVLAIEPLVKTGSAPPAVIAFYGAAVAEAQDDERFSWWLGQVNAQVKQFPEYWAAIGAHFAAEAKNEQAIRACAEALSRDPTDMRSIRRIGQSFINLGNHEMEDRWAKRYEALTKTVDASLRVADSQPPSVDAILELSQALASLGRPLESVMWQYIAAIEDNATPATIEELGREMRAAMKDAHAFPDNSVSLCGLSLNDFPNVELNVAALNTSPIPDIAMAPRPTTPPIAKFTDISKRVGLEHRFNVASQQRDKAFAIYQSFGGGIGILDYDLDGKPDIYLAQGSADPPAFKANQSDLLFRSVPTSAGVEQLRSVTASAGLLDEQYSIGVTCGDWNQDGFPDIAVSNIGVHMMMLNNGDGTFEMQPIDPQPSLTRGSSSLALADVTGDHLPDLYILNYLDDTNLITQPTVNANGQVENAISPFSVKAALDDLWINDGQGGKTLAKMGDQSKDPKHGLGIVISDFVDSPGNEIFVGNDEQPNQLWIRDPVSHQWSDQAAPRGCAFSSLGTATGSMGIAAADFDRSGDQDIHIANFYNEPVSFYLNTDGVFRDKNVKYRLDEPSMSVVGFGSQAIDYTNDGWVDLVVTNGHVEDLNSIDQPFRQPMQLFSNLADRFELVHVDDVSGYWEKPHVGRGLATVDFNRDGKLDLVVTDILDPTALLLNESPSENHWIGFRLIGTKSERDAVGARIELQAGSERWFGWVNAGNGYLSKNESAVVFGVGSQSHVNQAIVTWPSGVRQTFLDLPLDSYVQLTENDETPFVLD